MDTEQAERFEVRVLCRDCGKVLNNTVPMTQEELRRGWTHLVLSSGLVTGACPSGCRSTYSDLNVNTALVVFNVETGERVKRPL